MNWGDDGVDLMEHQVGARFPYLSDGFSTPEPNATAQAQPGAQPTAVSNVNGRPTTPSTAVVPLPSSNVLTIASVASRVQLGSVTSSVWRRIVVVDGVRARLPGIPAYPRLDAGAIARRSRARDGERVAATDEPSDADTDRQRGDDQGGDDESSHVGQLTPIATQALRWWRRVGSRAVPFARGGAGS